MTAPIHHASTHHAHTHHAHHTHKPTVSLVIYPGEGLGPDGKTTVGRIYVLGGSSESYEMAGGPPPGKGYKKKSEGGHSAGSTPAGHYVLDAQEHHVTQGWPMSVIPWGAKLREHGGELQYETGGHWVTATGRHGTVAQAALRFLRKSGKHPTQAEIDQAVWDVFHPGGVLRPTWDLNDFGNWAWNMKRHGHRSVYYIHTTPDDEAATAAKVRFNLGQSHGCIHIRPVNRDEMMRKGYLKVGIPVDVKPYGQKGPPAGH